MHFKLLVVFVEDEKTDDVLEAAREAGATRVVDDRAARGEGMDSSKSFFGMSLTTQRDVLTLLVEEHLSREILEHICEIGEFDDKPGTGLAIQIDVEDAVGASSQAERLVDIVEEQL